MKKVYTLLAVAAAVCCTATAAPKLAVKKAQAQVAVSEKVMLSDDPVGHGIEVSAQAPVKVPAKAISSVQELAGLKKWHGIQMFDEKYIPGTTTAVNGDQSGVANVADPREDRITINDFPTSGMTIKAPVDWAKKEVYIESGEFIGTVQNQTEGLMEVYIHATQHTGIVYDAAVDLWVYKEKPVAAEQAVGKIQDDGSISFDGYTLIATTSDGRMFYMANTANVVFEAAPSNTPVESEYTSRGFGEYVDPFFIPAFDGSQTVPVNKKAEIFTKKVDGAIMVAVKNPYKDVPGTVVDRNGNKQEVDNFWKTVGFQEGTGEGWLVFQVFNGDKFKAYPNATACLQMVFCGAVSDDSEAQDGSELTEYYPYNLEGSILYESGEDALLSSLERFETNGLAYSSLENNVISIRNTYFGITGEQLAGYWWQTSAGESAPHPVGTVTLPDGWNEFSGIESVAGDDVNAPVKYYNLQGIELAAPVKGQLVIKKQGNKTVKFIAK